MTTETIQAFMKEPLWGAAVGDYALALLIFLVAFLLKGIIASLCIKVLNALFKRLSSKWELEHFGTFKRSLERLFMLLGAYIGLGLVPDLMKAHPGLITAFKMAAILLVAVALYRLEGFFNFLFKSLDYRMNLSRSQLLKQFSIKVFRLVLVVFALAAILSQLGIDVGALVAGLGLAGLAFALAAQDTISNVFAGVTMIVDKPFDVGDRVLTNGIDGIVEDINFRSTRIRTLEQEFVTLPNSKIAGDAIVNYTKRDMRKSNIVLGFTYSATKAQIQAFIEALKIYLVDLPEEVDDTSVIIRLKGFGPSGIEVLVHYLTKTSDWGVYLGINEKVHYQIMNLLVENGLHLAYPSTSVYLENLDPKQGD